MSTPNVHPTTIADKKTQGQKHRTRTEIDDLKSAADKFSAPPIDAEPPAWLTKEAKAIWKRKIREIMDLKSPDVLLTNLDGDTLAMWCVNMARFMKLAQKNGKSTADDHQEMLRLNKSLREDADKLGFTPASRARLIRKAAFGKEKDPLENFD